MEIVELILLIATYSVLILTIFIGLICYRRNLERWETIAFAISLLLLIISITVNNFFQTSEDGKSSGLFMLLSMILVSLTTPLDVLAERKHNIAPVWKKVLYGLVGFLLLATVITYFLGLLIYVEFPIIFFLAISVILSMLLVMRTKPLKNVAYREKIDRISAIGFMILVPVFLFVQYALVNRGYDLKIGFILPLAFILLAGSKLMDDLNRLSLLKPSVEPMKQHFDNYAISTREREIATLLTQGKTYKEIGETLHISMPTVKSHASNIYKKCGVKTRSELTALLIN